jgi:hypothetical protein
MTEGAGLLGSAALVPQANRYIYTISVLGLVDQIDETVFDKRFLYLLFQYPIRKGSNNKR